MDIPKNDFPYGPFIWGFLISIFAMGGCVGCSMGGKKSSVDSTLDTLDEYCDFAKIEFQDDTEEARLKSITCHSKLRYGL